MGIKKILAVLLSVSMILVLVASGSVADYAEANAQVCDDEHQHEMQVSCAYEWCWCGYVIPGPSAHRFYWVINGHSGHSKLCVNCWLEIDYEAHGYITVNGVTYCGSCGYTP